MTRPPFTAAVLTVSDSASAGDRRDESGQVASVFVEEIGGRVRVRKTVPDEREAIAACLIDWTDRDRVDLILTTGGTGFAERDVTPEATRGVIEREAPGLAEAMRRETVRHTPLAVLSRGVAGIRGTTLIVNLPGSPKGVRQCLDVLAPVLPHALRVLSGAIRQHTAADTEIS